MFKTPFQPMNMTKMQTKMVNELIKKKFPTFPHKGISLLDVSLLRHFPTNMFPFQDISLLRCFHAKTFPFSIHFPIKTISRCFPTKTFPYQEIFLKIHLNLCFLTMPFCLAERVLVQWSIWSSTNR